MSEGAAATGSSRVIFKITLKSDPVLPFEVLSISEGTPPPLQSHWNASERLPTEASAIMTKNGVKIVLSQHAKDVFAEHGKDGQQNSEAQSRILLEEKFLEEARKLRPIAESLSRIQLSFQKFKPEDSVLVDKAISSVEKSMSAFEVLERRWKRHNT